MTTAILVKARDVSNYVHMAFSEPCMEDPKYDWVRALCDPTRRIVMHSFSTKLPIMDRLFYRFEDAGESYLKFLDRSGIWWGYDFDAEVIN